VTPVARLCIRAEHPVFHKHFTASFDDKPPGLFQTGRMELLFAYAAGLLTLINPCVLPVLPIVLAGSLQASRYGPLALTAGMGVAFVTLGFGVIAAGHLVGLTPEMVAQAGAVLMILFGIVLMVPRLSSQFALATAGVSERADGGMQGLEDRGWQGQFLGGMLLGAIWSPCVGPTLGGAIALASQGEELFRAFLIMVAFALGIGTIMLALGYGARSFFQNAWAPCASLRRNPAASLAPFSFSSA
jgi:cytochrome c-type biogenesis protein